MGIFNNNQQATTGNQQAPTGNQQATTGNQQFTLGQAPRKGYIYRCVENCVFNKRPYKAGETVILFEKKESVPHFVFAGESDKA